MAEAELLDAETSTEVMVASKYGIAKQTIQEAIDRANDLAATNPTDKAGIETVRRYRLDVLRPMRLTVDRKHDEIKKDALNYCKVTDRVAKELKAMIEPAEERLQEIEDAPKREAERLAKIAEEARAKEFERRQQLAFDVRWQIQPIMLNMLSPVEFEAAYLKEKERFDAEQKAHADAQAAIQAEKERQDKIAKEQAERQAEIDRKEAALAEQQRKIDAERLAARHKIGLARLNELNQVSWQPRHVDEVADLTDADFAAMLTTETEKYVAIQKANAEAAKLKAEQEARDLEARIERQAAERAAKIEAERVAEEQRKQAAKEKAEAAARRKAARAPDREKVRDFTRLIEGLEWPQLSKEAVTFQAEIMKVRANVINELEAIAESLE